MGFTKSMPNEDENEIMFLIKNHNIIIVTLSYVSYTCIEQKLLVEQAT